MRLTDSQLDALESGEAELQSLAHLLERIVDQNQDASVEELRRLGIAWELVLAATKELQTLLLRQGAIGQCDESHSTKKIL